MEKTLNRMLIYAGKVLNLRVDEVILEDGKKAKREVVEHKGAAVIIPVLDDGKIVTVRQYRYPVGEELIELPAGTLEKEEAPIDAAKRELLEETGYMAKDVQELACFYSSPGFCNEKMHLFLATNLVEGAQKLESDEKVQVEVYSVDELKEMIRNGEIKDAKTIAGILYYLLLWNERTS
ncbi:MAG: NUDIX hydrolase [bacterium 42_11]|nr:MAG: NUDIX hydrolase [bacterium 42_11]